MPDWPTRRDFLITVQYEATRAGLDPQLVLGLIQHESNFRKYAVSSADARGYMQVMPFWVKQIGTPDHNLFNLRTNLRYGCTILRHYLDMENGDYYRALGRYNGSLGRPEYPNAVLANWKQNWSWTLPRGRGGRPRARRRPTTDGQVIVADLPRPLCAIAHRTAAFRLADRCAWQAGATRAPTTASGSCASKTSTLRAVEPGASDAILTTLAAYGFEWDGAVVRQSERTALYRAALDDLVARGLAFPCALHAQGTRTRAARDRRRTRLSGNLSQRRRRRRVPARAWRLRVSDKLTHFIDRLAG